MNTSNEILERKEIGERIKNRRVEMGLTQKELADLCGIPFKQSVGRLERGMRTLYEDEIARIALALGCTTAHLLAGDSGRRGELKPALRESEDDSVLVLHRRPSERTTVLVYPDTATRVREIAKATGYSMTELVDKLLRFGLSRLEIRKGGTEHD